MWTTTGSLAGLHYELLLTVQRNDAALQLCLRESGLGSAAFFVDFTYKYSSPIFLSLQPVPILAKWL
jgi:hypothetical protein